MYQISRNYIFDKEYQDKLKRKYEIGLREAWNNSEKMVKYDMSRIAYLVPICDGKYIISLSKPILEKEFHFGYSDMGQGLSYEENNERMKNVRQNLAEHFKKENLSSVNNEIEMVEKIIEGKTWQKAYHFVTYYSAPEDSIIHQIGYDTQYGRTFNGKSYDFDIRDLKLFLIGLKYLKEYTEKKIDTYLKKYGTSKLHVSSYWIDR